MDQPEVPNAERAASIARRIHMLWNQHPIPSAEVAIEPDRSHLRENANIEKYFSDRHFSAINAEAPSISEEFPFLGGLTASGIHYYTASYLLHLVELNRHCSPVLKGCFGTPSIHARRFLCSPQAAKTPYSDEERKAVIDVLELMKDYPDYYLLDEMALEEIAAALRMHKSLCRS